jgi:hypothetical protein
MPAALLLVTISAPDWNRNTGWLSRSFAVLLVLLASLGIGYGSYQILDDFVLNIPVPRMRNMRFLPGTVELWAFLHNKFGWTYEVLQKALPAAAGLFGGIVIVLAIGLAFHWAKKRINWKPAGYSLLVVFLTAGALFSPIKLLGGGKFADYCETDVIASHEAVGNHLAGLIPPGSLVFWQNDVSPLPLLYLPGIEIFPPQLNQSYSFRQGGDPDILAMKGLWNAELADQWINEADYFLVAEQHVPALMENDTFAARTDELPRLDRTATCRPNTVIHVFKRIQ